LPEIDYVWGSTNPAVEGWPAVGQAVIWQAHIKNWANSQREVAYKWYLDGQEVAAGTVDMSASAEDSVDFEWNWTFERHVLTFVIDPDNLIEEEEEVNNSLSIYTDAITVGFYVEQSVYDYFREHQHKLGVGSNSWEDWAQRQIIRWNEMLANAIYPETPNGVLDRVRLDKITVVADGALPLVPIDHIDQQGAGAETHPNISDRTVDMQWGFTKDGYLNGFFSNHTSVSDNNPFYLLYAGNQSHLQWASGSHSVPDKRTGLNEYRLDLYGSLQCCLHEFDCRASGYQR